MTTAAVSGKVAVTMKPETPALAAAGSRTCVDDESRDILMSDFPSYSSASSDKSLLVRLHPDAAPVAVETLR